MATILDARVKQKVATEAQWLADTTILLEGEQAFVVNSGNVPINFKIGDGTKKFADLPYYFDYTKNVGYRGSVVPTSPVQPTGDFFVTATQAGTYANYGGVVIPVNSFGVISRVGGVWSSSITNLDTGTVKITDIGIKADPETNLFSSGTVQVDKLVNSSGVIQNTAGWNLITIPIDPANPFIYISDILYSRAMYWRFDNSSGTLITNGTLATANPYGYKIPVPPNTIRVHIDIKAPADSESIYANMIVSYKGFANSILGLDLYGMGGGGASDQNLNTTDSVKFAGLETDALKVNGLPTTSSGAAIGGIWIDIANGNVLKVRTV